MGTAYTVEAARSARRQELRGTAEIVAAMALAGSSVVVGKVLSVRIPVFLSAELSLLFALAAIAPLQIARRRELRRVGGAEIVSMLLQALFGIVLFRVLTLYGLHFTTAAHAGLITSAAPAVMAVLAALLLRERPGGWGLAGIGCAVAGLFLVNLSGLIETPRPGVLLGNVLVLGAAVCESLLTIFRKTSGGRIGSITNTTILVGMSALMLLPFALGELRAFRLSAIDTLGWLAVGYYGAVATVIAYILWGDGALRIPAGRTGIATSAMPVSAVALSALFLREPVGLVTAAGCAVVACGILIGGKRKVGGAS